MAVDRMRRVGLAAFLGMGIAMVAARPAAGTIIMSDPFTDGGVTNGADPLDTSWTAGTNGTGSGAGTLGVIADATLPARGAINSNVMTWTPGATFQAAFGGFNSSTLANTGNFVTATFDFRFQSTPGTQSGGGFRFGLYNSNGTGTNDADDFGYYATVSTGAATASNSLFRETGGTGGIASGTDRTQIGATNTNATAITGTEAHTGLVTITRTGATSLNVLVQVDGSTILNLTDSAASNFTFDQVAFGNASNSQALNFDNVVIDSNVPEPTSIGVLGLAGFAALARRRSGRARA